MYINNPCPKFCQQAPEPSFSEIVFSRIYPAPLAKGDIARAEYFFFSTRHTCFNIFAASVYTDPDLSNTNLVPRMDQVRLRELGQQCGIVVRIYQLDGEEMD
jgi:hypothetical protein